MRFDPHHVVVDGLDAGYVLDEDLATATESFVQEGTGGMLTS